MEDVQTFEQLGLAGWIGQTCKEMGFRRPTPIQVQCVPHVLKGKNVIGKAQTGSGKTAAFALPILSKLSKDPYGIYALVLTPTRELAIQIDEQFRALGVHMDVRTAVIVGGMDMLAQSQLLSLRPHIVIATPGRLADHLLGGCNITLDQLAVLVLDEADRLFEDSFQNHLDIIVKACPPSNERQTLLFSATMTSAVTEYKTVSLSNAEYCHVDSEVANIVKTLDQKYLFMPQRIKQVYLIHVLKLPQFENSSTIIFTSTCKGCEIVANLLLEMEIDCVTLHSQKTQARRIACLGKFKGGKSRILVATDVASRGLDIPTVQLVLNFDVPRNPEDYIHRVGRTARAGRDGVALTFLSQYDINLFKDIEAELGTELEEFKIDETKALELLNSVTQAAQMAKLKTAEFDLTARTVKRRDKNKQQEEEHDGDAPRGAGVKSQKKLKRKKVSVTDGTKNNSTFDPSTPTVGKKKR